MVVAGTVATALVSTARSSDRPVSAAGVTAPATGAADGARFIRKLRAGEPVVIVTMGTSLTRGDNKWVPLMAQWLNESFPGRATVFNEGLGRSASAHKRPDRSGLHTIPKVLAHDPDVVFIEFAFNDAYRPYRISVEQSKRNLNVLIDQILAHNHAAEIILQTMNCPLALPRQVENPVAARANLPEYYQVYRDVAAERGLMLIDHYPNWLALLEADPERFIRLVPDGIHPQLDGSREVILPQIQRSLAGEGAAE